MNYLFLPMLLYFSTFARSNGLSEIQKIEPGNLTNLHQVDEFLYRSEQPQRSDFKALEKLGIRTVIDLRNRFNDRHELKGTHLNECHYPINSWKINYQNLLDVLVLLREAEKPVLVHCLHGADRTGCVAACYRIVFNGWSKAAAIEEFLNPKFGYHDGWFPRMRELLDSLDEEKLKNDVQSHR